MTSETPECPIVAFLNCYAPFSPSQQFINKALNDLHKDPHRLLKKVGTGASRVWALADLNTFSNAHEATTLKNFKKIMDVLQKVEYVDGNGNRRECRFFYKNCSSNDMLSRIEGTNLQVDACITGNVDAKEVALSDIAAVVEFKRPSSSNNVRDNCSRLFSTANQIMNDDPRRMWVYGIKIEGKQMAAWYFCRSYSIKSESFNFTTDVKSIISLFLSLLYATEPEIGYDPTVHRVMYSNEICYVYEVGTQEAPRYYRTTKLLFTARMSRVTGRATRVWKMVEVEYLGDGRFGKDIGGEVVLKDGWVDEDSRSEQEIQTAIFERLSIIEQSDYQWAPRSLRDRLNEAFQNDKYKEYFMEVLDSRRIGKTKRHPHILFFEEHKPPNSVNSSKRMVDGSTRSKDYSRLPANDNFSLTSGKRRGNSHPREYKTKEQHRLIYRYVGCALKNTEDLLTSFIAIQDTFIALVLLYLAGWTHRDVSAGNIIVVGKGNSARGKLSDLEYAKEFNDNSSNADPKTGTLYFMPYEIHSGMSLYNPRPVLNLYANPEDTPGVDPPGRREMLRKDFGQCQPARPLKFRFQHDLESLWWVMIWVLLYRVGGIKALELLERIFTYSDVPSFARTQFFIKENCDLEIHIDDRLKHLTPYLLDIRNILIDSYWSNEKTENLLLHSEYAEIYVQMWAPLGWLVKSVRETPGITFQNLSPQLEAREDTEETTKKRPRSESASRDDADFRLSRHGSKKGKTVPTEPWTTRLRLAKDVLSPNTS